MYRDELFAKSQGSQPLAQHPRVHHLVLSPGSSVTTEDVDALAGQAATGAPARRMSRGVRATKAWQRYVEEEQRDRKSVV